MLPTDTSRIPYRRCTAHTFSRRKRPQLTAITRNNMSEGVVILILLGIVTWLWHWSRAAYENTLNVSRAICKEINVQFLDDSVSLTRLSVTFVRQDHSIRRKYCFEFSTNGTDRSRGEVMLLGDRIEWVRINHPDGAYFIDNPANKFR